MTVYNSVSNYLGLHLKRLLIHVSVVLDLIRISSSCLDECPFCKKSFIVNAMILVAWIPVIQVLFHIFFLLTPGIQMNSSTLFDTLDLGYWAGSL